MIETNKQPSKFNLGAKLPKRCAEAENVAVSMGRAYVMCDSRVGLCRQILKSFLKALVFQIVEEQTTRNTVWTGEREEGRNE